MNFLFFSPRCCLFNETIWCVYVSVSCCYLLLSLLYSWPCSPSPFMSPNEETWKPQEYYFTLFAFDSQRLSAIKAYRVTDECLPAEEAALFSMGPRYVLLSCVCCLHERIFSCLLTSCCGLSFLLSHSRDVCMLPDLFRFLWGHL